MAVFKNYLYSVGIINIHPTDITLILLNLNLNKWFMKILLKFMQNLYLYV